MIWIYIVYTFTVVLLCLPVILVIAFLTLMERKVLASIQIREGPNWLWFFGVGQPFADAFKLIFKEPIQPQFINLVIYLLSPIFSFVFMMLSFSILLWDIKIFWMDWSLSYFFILTLGSLGSYTLLCSGWSSNSFYSLLGALRSTSQMISYEIYIALLLLSIMCWTNSLQLSVIMMYQNNIWFGGVMIPILIIFFITALAETSRSPFDLPEGESELVSGYNVEYSSLLFALFFLSEYGHLIFQSFLIVVLFLGGTIYGILWKVILILFIIIWVRGSVPRYRLDLLLNLGWKVYMPFSFCWIYFESSWVRIFDWVSFSLGT